MGVVFSLLYLSLYICGGMMIIRCLLPRKSVVTRVWLGSCLGILLMMWLPLLCALLFRFSLTAHLAAIAPLCLLCGGCLLLRSHEAPKPFDEKDKKLLIALACVALPLTIVGGYLQWTHNIAPDADGALHVGQSTYGDLNLHLGIITSLRNARIPADYSIFPGERLCYPFLTDSFSTSFMIFGCSLRCAVVLPGILLMALTFSGYLILAWRIGGQRRIAVLAALFFFINGGLGFFYSLDMMGVNLGSSGNNELQAGTGLLARLNTILQGWYQTPANHAEFTTYNLRWSNVIADMLIPQRTILGGWCMLLPCLYLLWDMIRPEEDSAIEPASDFSGEIAPAVSHPLPLRKAILLGCWAGALPMVHTHCFLALGLCSFGWMSWDVIEHRRMLWQHLKKWLIYGGLAVMLALPQLLTWTFSQVSSGSGFLTLQFNWVNNSGGWGLRDEYFWFYIKNIGLPFLLLIIALFEKDKKLRFIAVGAFMIFIPAEFIRFQPNEYDNNKLFYVWYMLCAVIAADYALRLFDRLKGLRGRWVIAALCCFTFFCTGTLSITRECISDYQTFNAVEVEAAAYIEENTEEHSVFMTCTDHINPVSALTGRTIVCGPSLWLYWHGFDITERESRIRAFYSDPAHHTDVLEDYQVDYIYYGYRELWAGYDLNSDAMNALYELVWQSNDGIIRIWKAAKE